MMAATLIIWCPEWEGNEGPHRMQVSCVEISRAYFHVRVEDHGQLYVDLPPEDEDFGKDFSGRLNVHMYSNRPAADGWHTECSGSMMEFGFMIGTSSSCVFYRPGAYLVCSVHGDDFTTVGPKSSLDKFVEDMKSKHELKEAARLGPGKGDDKETRVLNRVVRWTEQGLEYEADPRQAEKIIQELGLEDCKAVATPAVRQSMEHINKDEPIADHTI